LPTFLILAAVSPAEGGTISIQATPSIQIAERDARGIVSLKNSGNEVAMRVAPQLILGSVSWIGDPVTIYPNQIREWQVELTSPDERYLSVHPLIVKVSYADANGFSFSNLQIFGQKREEDLRLETGIRRLSGEGKFHISGYLTNQAEAAKDITVRLLVPNEFDVSPPLFASNLERSLNVYFTVQGRNVIEGSAYVAYLLASWVEEGGFGHVWQPVVIRIEPERYGTSWMYAGVIGALVGLVYLVFSSVFRKPGVQARDNL
jgi:hypothetical protein